MKSSDLGVVPLEVLCSSWCLASKWVNFQEVHHTFKYCKQTRTMSCCRGTASHHEVSLSWYHWWKLRCNTSLVFDSELSCALLCPPHLVPFSWSIPNCRSSNTCYCTQRCCTLMYYLLRKASKQQHQAWLAAPRVSQGKSSAISYMYHRQ